MTKAQRETINEFFKGILENGEAGDFVNCYNDSKRLIIDLSDTDEKLKEMIVKTEHDFENPF